MSIFNININESGGKSCKVARVIANADERGDGSGDELRSFLESPEVTASAIANAINGAVSSGYIRIDGGGISERTVLRHRNGVCSCPVHSKNN